MIAADLVLQADWVVPIAQDPIEQGWVALSAGRIAAIGRGKAPFAERFVDLKRRVLMPGLINAHTHLGCSFLDLNSMERSAEPVDFLSWIDKEITPAVMAAYFGSESDVSRPRLVKAALRAVDTMASSGATTIVDSFFDAIGFDVIKKRGLRGMFCREFFGSRSNDLNEYIESMRQRSIQDAAQFQSERMQFGLAPHALYSCPRDVLVEVFGQARDQKLPVTIHVAESPEESQFFIHGQGAMKDLFAPGEKKERYDLGKSPVRMMHDLGLLGPSVILVHMVQVSEDDLDLVAESGAGIVHCPASNAVLNVGLAPVKRMLERGIPVAIGTDSLASNLSMDLFDELRFAKSINHQSADGLAQLSSQEVLRMATMDGAQVCGLTAHSGSIEVGKMGDLLVMAPTQAEADLPKRDELFDWIVGTGSRVDVTFVSGETCFEANGVDR